MWESLKQWGRRIKRDVVAVYFAARDPATPCLVRVLALTVAAYALSPIDLIPDFIPIIGYLDEVILLPGAIWLALKLMPRAVLLDSRAKAQAWLEAHRPKRRNWVAATAIVLLWSLVLCALWLWWINPRLALK